MSTTAKSMRTERIGKAEVRLLQTPDGYAGVVNYPGRQSPVLYGDDADILWRKLLVEVGKAHPSYFGFDGARSRFLRGFPAGFADTIYITKERTYKKDAAAKVEKTLSLDQARTATIDDSIAAIRAFQATNLVSVFEKSRIKDVLQDAAGAAYLNAATRFAEGEVAAGLAGMVSAIREAGQVPSWPMLTYLPFLWRPDQHLFLKPQVTRDFAYRVGHPFARDYDAGLTVGVYESLLDLSAETWREISDLNPSDLIDVQGFIWVVGAYTDVELEGAR